MIAAGIVIIGRNEGARLSRCITAAGVLYPVVYVDSGSSDGSCETARALGADVVELDSSSPFTAARGRNAGVVHLLETHPELTFVQFVDGDCEINLSWMERAIDAMRSDNSLGVVCGRLREKNTASIYGRLCDMEWNGPIGELAACGGVMFARIAALGQAGWFNEDVAAGEEADLCIRLRGAKYRVVRIAAEMGTHDAGMTRFSQWWRRAQRAGRSYMQGALLHGGGDERRHVKALQSIVFWSLLWPILVGVVASLRGTPALVLLALYPLLWFRIYRRRITDGESGRNARLFATFCILAKFAQMIGVFAYVYNDRRFLKSAAHPVRNGSGNKYATVSSGAK